MLASSHLSAGLVAGMAAARAGGSTARRVVIALFMGLASHVILDAIPHADYGFLARRYVIQIVLCETAVVFGLGAWILRRRVAKGWQWLLAAGLFGAAIPDARFGLEVLPSPLRHRVLYATYWFHSFFHAEPVVFWIGMTTQVVAALACIAALFAFPIEERSAPPSA